MTSILMDVRKKNLKQIIKHQRKHLKVFESEGHDVDDDEVLVFYQKDHLMLLGDNEDWVRIYFCLSIRILFM